MPGCGAAASARPLRVLAGVLGVAALLLVAMPARAGAATANVTDQVGDSGTGAAQTDVTSTSVSWQAPTLTVSATFAAPPSFQAFDLLVSDSLDADDETTCAADSADSFTVTARRDLAPIPSARLTAPFLAAALTAQPQVTANTVTWSFLSPELTEAIAQGQDPFTCLSGESDGDGFFGAFAGKTLKLTPPVATTALVAELTRRFGARFTSAAGKWLKCPTVEILPPSDETGPLALCQFQFSLGRGLYRGGAFSAELVSGTLIPRHFSSRSYSKRLRPCRIRRNLRTFDPRVLSRKLLASGFVTCSDSSASLIRDLHGMKPGTRRVAFHGTNRAGFEDQVRFRCRLIRRGDRYTARCRNRLGDRFVYRYTLQDKPAARPAPRPRPTPPTSRCDPNYSGACLRPNVSDYDCRGGGGDGPYYTGPVRVTGDDHYDLDRDGNGRACEAS